MSGLYYLRSYLRRHLRTIFLGILLIIGSNILSLILPYIIRLAIDSITQHGITGDLVHLAWFLIGASVITGFFQFGARFVIAAVSREIEYELRNDLYRHFERIDVAYFQRNRLGDLVARATNDLTAVRMMLGPGINNFLNTFFAITATLLVMANIDLRLMLYVAIILPLMSILFFTVNDRIRKSYKLVQDQFGVVSARAQENFSGIRVVKAYAQEIPELSSFNGTNMEYVRRSIRFLRIDAVLWPSMYIISGIAASVLLWRGGLDVIHNTISLGQLVQFNAYLGQLTWPMISLGWVVNLFQQGEASLMRLREVFEYTPAIHDGPQTQPDARISQGAISVQHLSFTYDDWEVLHDCSFDIPAGGSLGIVGTIGSGKTTLVNVLTRTFDAQDGTILYDGKPIDTIPLEHLRRAIGYVPQEPLLFSTSISENIAFGRPDATRKEIEEALEISQLIKDVADFPQGIDTVIGERGVTLSGGQKQRTGIARAVAKKPVVLILDDSLSSVDTNTEAEILQRLHAFMQNRTSIVIAHRISTVKDLDQIIVLEEGAIVERGSHNELVQLKGRYHAMYRRQLLGEELDSEVTDDLQEITQESLH